MDTSITLNIRKISNGYLVSTLGMTLNGMGGDERYFATEGEMAEALPALATGALERAETEMRELEVIRHRAMAQQQMSYARSATDEVFRRHRPLPLRHPEPGGLTMDTQHISPRMLEAGEAIARDALNKEWLELDDAPEPAELATAIYLAMRAKHVESLGGE